MTTPDSATGGSSSRSSSSSSKFHVQDPPVIKRVGRPQEKQFKSRPDASISKLNGYKCGLCGEVGHIVSSLLKCKVGKALGDRITSEEMWHLLTPVRIPIIEITSHCEVELSKSSPPSDATGAYISGRDQQMRLCIVHWQCGANRMDPVVCTMTVVTKWAKSGMHLKRWVFVDKR